MEENKTKKSKWVSIILEHFLTGKERINLNLGKDETSISVVNKEKQLPSVKFTPCLDHRLEIKVNNNLEEVLAREEIINRLEKELETRSRKKIDLSNITKENVSFLSFLFQLRSFTRKMLKVNKT